MFGFGWELVLIVLVPVGVWFLSTVFKGEDDRPGSRQNPESRPAPQRRPVSDLDRFLEEARRRREAAERRQPPEVIAPPRPEPRPEPRPAPQREQRPAKQPFPQQRRRPVESASPRPNRPPVILEPVPEAPAPVSSPARLEMVRMEPPRTDPSQLHLPMQAALVAAPAAPRISKDRSATSPTLVQLATLLRSPQAAGLAIALRAVFDPPLCRRRR